MTTMTDAALTALFANRAPELWGDATPQQQQKAIQAVRTLCEKDGTVLTPYVASVFAHDLAECGVDVPEYTECLTGWSGPAEFLAENSPPGPDGMPQCIAARITGGQDVPLDESAAAWKAAFAKDAAAHATETVPTPTPEVDPAPKAAPAPAPAKTPEPKHRRSPASLAAAVHRNGPATRKGKSATVKAGQAARAARKAPAPAPKAPETVLNHGTGNTRNQYLAGGRKADPHQTGGEAGKAAQAKAKATMAREGQAMTKEAERADLTRRLMAGERLTAALLATLTKPILDGYCREKGLTGYSTMAKDLVIQYIVTGVRPVAEKKAAKNPPSADSADGILAWLRSRNGGAAKGYSAADTAVCKSMFKGINAKGQIVGRSISDLKAPELRALKAAILAADTKKAA